MTKLDIINHKNPNDKIMIHKNTVATNVPWHRGIA